MKRYLSYGAGVNSEALRLLLIDQGIDFEAVYVDHGCDWPETRELAKTILDLAIIKPDVEGFSNLYEYCMHYSFVPCRRFRWCSDKFKVRPQHKYFKRPCVCYIGFAADETHRCKASKEADIYNEFPLIKAEMTRRDCKQFILDHHLEVPIKSGCWICPFQRNEQWRRLKRLHPDLYEKAKILEQTSMARRIEKGKLPLTLSANGKRLEVITMEGQMELF